MNPLCFMKLFALLLAAFLPFSFALPFPVPSAVALALGFVFFHQFWLAVQLRQLDLGMQVSLPFTMLWCDVLAFLLGLLAPFLWLSALLAPAFVARCVLLTLPPFFMYLSVFWRLPWFWPGPVPRLAFLYHDHTSPARGGEFD